MWVLQMLQTGLCLLWVNNGAVVSDSGQAMISALLNIPQEWTFAPFFAAHSELRISFICLAVCLGNEKKKYEVFKNGSGELEFKMKILNPPCRFQWGPSEPSLGISRSLQLLFAVVFCSKFGFLGGLVSSGCSASPWVSHLFLAPLSVDCGQNIWHLLLLCFQEFK